MSQETTTPSQTISLDGLDTPVSTPAPANEVFTAKGDRHPAVNLVYPEAAFMHAGKGGRLIDVTKPPFNAKGDGKTDDTQALIAARDFVMKNHEPACCGRHLLKGNYILYLPNGTYLVSDSVNHSLPVRVGWPGSGSLVEYLEYWKQASVMTEAETRTPLGQAFEQNDSIIILGQSRDKTILRLKDHCPGFGAGAAKPVLAFFHFSIGSNVNQNNVIENVTVDTGRGNPGACGIRWNAANTGAIRNLTVRSGDGAGVAGLMLDVESVHGLIEDVSVHGFDTGIVFRGGPLTLEHACFGDQKRLGMLVTSGRSFSARDIIVNGAPTALRVELDAHCIILDSSFHGTNDAAAAIDLVDAHLFARNIQTAGYAVALACDGKSVLASPRVEEYVSGPTLCSVPGTPVGSLRLPIEDSPRILHEANPANWANVDDFGALGDGVADDTPAIQQAMNSGKPAILFTRNFYLINGTVTIPKTVRQVSFLYGCVIRTQFREEALFRVAEPSSEPLLLQQSAYNMGGVFLDHAADRTVVLEDVASLFASAGRSAILENAVLNPIKPAQYDDSDNCWRLYRNATPAGKPKRLFVNNCLGFAPGGPDNRFAVENVTVWCRQANTEGFMGNNFAFRRSTAWILGFKTENEWNARDFSALDGTRLEVLGGIFILLRPKTAPHILARDSAVSVVLNVEYGSADTPMFEDVMSGETNMICGEDCPLRFHRETAILPLLVNYSAPYPIVDGARPSLPPRMVRAAPDLAPPTVWWHYGGRVMVRAALDLVALPADGEAVQLRLRLCNDGVQAASGTVAIGCSGIAGATLAGDTGFAYRLAPGEGCEHRLTAHAAVTSATGWAGELTIDAHSPDNLMRPARLHLAWPRPRRISPWLVDGWQVSPLLPAGDITAVPYVPPADDGTWTPVPPGPGRGSGNAHFVNVNELRGPDGMVYLARKVKVAEAGSWILHVGHDGGARVFVDGKPVGASAGAINPAPYTRTSTPVTLAAGEHEIVVALDRAGGKGWGIFVSFEIPENSGDTTRKLTFPEPT